MQGQVMPTTHTVRLERRRYGPRDILLGDCRRARWRLDRARRSVARH